MITLGCVDFFDRTRPILERQVEAQGLEVQPVALKPMELLGRFTEFDACELPLFAYLALHSLGEDDYLALPVFPHRGYPHGSVVVREASGITQAKDLAGRRVGTPGLFLSGTVWMRGILEEDHGLDAGGIRWVIPAPARDSAAWRITGRLIERSGIQVEQAPAGRQLSDLLERGDIDAWIGPLPPECFERGAPGLRRLFPDYPALERDYAARTRFIPALHTVVVRRRLRDKAAALVALFQRARDAGLRNLHNDNVFAVMLPWMRHHIEESTRIFGADWVPSGFASNRSMIEAALKYAARQGLTTAPRSPKELFSW